MIKLLQKIGIVRYHRDGSVRWPVHVSPRHIWYYLWKSPGQRIGVFRNLPHVIKDVGTWLPRRWGFHILGFEIGQRDQGYGAPHAPQIEDRPSAVSMEIDP